MEGNKDNTTKEGMERGKVRETGKRGQGEKRDKDKGEKDIQKRKMAAEYSRLLIFCIKPPSKIKFDRQA